MAQVILDGVLDGMGTHGVDDDGGPDRAGDGGAVLRVLGAAHERLMVVAEEGCEDGEDDDGEYGDDGAVFTEKVSVSLANNPALHRSLLLP